MKQGHKKGRPKLEHGDGRRGYIGGEIFPIN